MKTFLRVLSFANNLPRRLFFFFVYSLLGTLFSLFNLVLMIPMLKVLFDKTKATTPPPFPKFELSSEFLSTAFNHFFLKVVQNEGRMGALIFVCTLLVGCAFLAGLFRYLERIVATKIRVGLIKNIRLKIFERLTLMHIGFFNTHPKGDLISRFMGDVLEVEGAIMNSLKVIFKEPVTIIVFFAGLFTLSPKLTLFTLIVLPVLGLVIAGIIRSLKKQAKESQESLGRIINIIDETIGGMRIIKSFNARHFIQDKFKTENEHYKNVNKSISYRNELASPMSEFLGISVVAIILFYGGKLVIEDSNVLDAESFLIFMAIFAQIIQPAKNFSNGITSMQKGTASGARIFSLIDQESEIKSKPNAQLLKKFDQSIDFKNVSFSYGSDKTVLKNINLTIAKGKTIALVGPSGGGKSTLADLVPRFYDPTEGEVCIDGVSLTDYDLESLRKHLGIVTQESILFNDTIFNNIAFGKPNVGEAEVIQAAKIANAHDFIMQTEHGYQTKIGERGSKLSGGQRQRLSIARAVLKNPPILILDEATSALDSESERLVQEALFNLMKNRTSIVIAHRLSTIQHADEILVVHDGIIAERGTHEDLQQRNGIYKKLSDIQKTG